MNPASASAPFAGLAPPPPPGLNYVAVIQPSIPFLLIGAACSASLVPIVVVLFFFSTPRVRRQPVFVLNVAVTALGFIEGVVAVYGQARYMLAKPVPVFTTTLFACLVVLVPMIADSILLLRVVTVHPPYSLRRSGMLAIYGPICVVKLARLTVEIMFIVQWSRIVALHADDPLQAGQEAWDTPYPKVVWFLQLFDSTYASIIFLLRLGNGTLPPRRLHTGPRFQVDNTGTGTGSTISSYYDRLRTLFWISASNFVFPVLLNLVQLILAFKDPSFLHGAYVLMVNNYVEIVGVLLATIWSTSTKYPSFATPGGTHEAHTMSAISAPRFAAASPAEGDAEEDPDDAYAGPDVLSVDPGASSEV